MNVPNTGESLVKSTTSERISILLLGSLQAFGSELERNLTDESYSMVYADTPAKIYSLASKITIDAVVIPLEASRNNNVPLWEELTHVLPRTSALYVVADAQQKKPEGENAEKIRAIIENTSAAKITAADFVAFLENRENSAEKRRWDRRPLTMGVKIKFDGAEFESVALNLSLGGFFAATPSSFPLPPIGTPIEFEFHIPGVTPICGKAAVQWTQEVPLNKLAPQARGVGCEFTQQDAALSETVCRLITALSSKKVPADFLSRVKVSDLVQKSLKNLQWLGSHSVLVKENLSTSTRECTCFEPILSLNLTGFLLGFCENVKGKIDTVSLDLAGPDYAVELKAEISGPAVTPETHKILSASMPSLFASAGGRENIALHHINLDFSLRADTLAVVFRFPTRGP